MARAIKVRKMLIFSAKFWSKFYKTQWSWQGVKLSWLISIFTSKNVWKSMIRIQLTKSNPKILRGVNPPCLMPIRVKDILILQRKKSSQVMRSLMFWAFFGPFGTFWSFFGNNYQIFRVLPLQICHKNENENAFLK